MVEAIGHKLATHHPVIEPVSAAEPGTEICDAETGTQKPAYHLAEITPAHEVQATGPTFAYGIPTVWVGLDEDDPPIFESQAAYLKRHGLLLDGEERRVQSSFEEPRIGVYSST
jgi:hypothetical protein